MGLFSNKKREDEEFVINYKASGEDDFFGMPKSAPSAPSAPTQLTKDEILGKEKAKAEVSSDVSPLEMLRRQMAQSSAKKAEEEIIDPQFSINTDIFDTIPMSSAPTEEAEPETVLSDDVSVLQKCMPFILDGAENTDALKEKPAYTLESVDSILGISSDEPEESTEAKAEPETADGETAVIDSEALKELEIKPVISDIDNVAVTVEAPTLMFEKLSDTKSINIADEMVGDEAMIDISSGAPLEDDSFNVETDEDENYTVAEDFEGSKNLKSVKLKLFKKRRTAFLKTVLSFIILGVLAVLRVPSVYAGIADALYVICGIAFFAVLLLNLDAFLGFKTLFTKRCSADCGAAAALISSCAYIVFGLVKSTNPENVYGITLLCTFVAFFRTLGTFMRDSYTYTNFIQIANKRGKYAMTLIDDTPTTFAMARHSIDGEVLVAAPQKVSNITDYIRNSTIDRDFGGKMNIITACSVLVALISAVMAGLYRVSFEPALCSFATVMCIFAPATLTLCSVLPLKSAASHLNRHGAMLTSVKTAEQINEANATVFACSDIFRIGTVTLAKMEVLAENDFQDTLACAAAITSSVDSPLAPVFNKIMETAPGIEIPAADSIKYEEALGITGWIDKKRIYIGNRSLMRAHEIEIPQNVDDKKILKRGYFPVYVACDGTACAVLAVKYTPDPDMAKELSALSRLGVTILVDNCDQNITEKMLCDYFGLYEDSVKIMNGSGVHMYKNAVPYAESSNSGAACGGKAVGFASIMTASIKTVSSVKRLRIMHFATIALSFLLYAYFSFGVADTTLGGATITLFQLAGAVISYIVFLFNKP